MASRSVVKVRLPSKVHPRTNNLTLTVEMSRRFLVSGSSFSSRPSSLTSMIIPERCRQQTHLEHIDSTCTLGGIVRMNITKLPRLILCLASHTMSKYDCIGLFWRRKINTYMSGQWNKISSLKIKARLSCPGYGDCPCYKIIIR